MKNKKVVVTGGCGFVGSNLAEELSKDNEVVIIDDLSIGKIANIQNLLKKAMCTLSKAPLPTKISCEVFLER